MSIEERNAEMEKMAANGNLVGATTAAPRRDYGEGDYPQNEPTAAEDRPLRAGEGAMLELEEELMILEDTVTSLAKRLSDITNGSGVLVAPGIGRDEDPKAAEAPQSKYVRSIKEKTKFVRNTRARVSAILNSVDL